MPTKFDAILCRSSRCSPVSIKTRSEIGLQARNRRVAPHGFSCSLNKSPVAKSDTVSLECRHAFHFLEPLPDEFHGTFVVHKVVLADSIFPFKPACSRCAGFQPKEFYRRDAKRDFESPHLIVNRSLFCLQQILDLRSVVSWSYIHSDGLYHNSRLNIKGTRLAAQLSFDEAPESAKGNSSSILKIAGRSSITVDTY